MKYLKIVIIVLVFSCNPVKAWKILRVSNDTSVLSIQGYYISSQNSVLFLYGDGSIYLTGLNKNEGESINQRINKVNKINQENKYLSQAGVYKIKQDTIIIIERRIDSDAFWHSTKITKQGKILNRATFVADIYGDKIDTFYFHPYPLKPDSTLFKYLPELND